MRDYSQMNHMSQTGRQMSDSAKVPATSPEHTARRDGGGRRVACKDCRQAKVGNDPQLMNNQPRDFSMYLGIVRQICIRKGLIKVFSLAAMRQDC